MSVLIVTSLGDIEVDLFTEKCPLTSKNFLKLCKMKYYNGNLFHTVQKDFTAQTGDPTGTGSGGESFYKFLYGDKARFFQDEINLDLKHAKTGTLAMASGGENLNASQFYFTLRDDLDYLDGKHTVFGEVVEGFDTLTRINEAFADENGRPYKNIRIKHTYIIDDPFEDPIELVGLIPDASPEGKPKDEVEDVVRLEDDWVPMDEQMGTEELVEVIRAKEAHSRAVVLETIGDIPDAEIKPPENVLFVCKLNPVTEDDDLHTIFSRFGTVTSAEIIRDYKTGDSLCYAFIEFELQESCEAAYFKMDNALIDDRRIHVDFSQSVSKLWSQYRRKDHQTGKGKGCFKCGETDHIAKDCTSSGPKTKQEDRKYVIKDENRQRGGGDDSRYEMVFDDDGRDTPRHEKRRHSPSFDKPRKRDSRARENRDSREYQDRRENRDSRESQDKEYRDSRESRDEEYRDRRKNRDKEYHRDGRESRDKEYRDSRESQDKEYRDSRQSRDKEFGDRRKNRDKEYRDGRENQDKEYRDKEYRDGRENRDKEYRDSRENRDKKDGRDRRRDEEKKEHRRR